MAYGNRNCSTTVGMGKNLPPDQRKKKRNSGISDISLCGRETGNNTHRGWQFSLYR